MALYNMHVSHQLKLSQGEEHGSMLHALASNQALLLTLPVMYFSRDLVVGYYA